jgi:two-component system, OmpR family, response regulator QseB
MHILIVEDDYQLGHALLPALELAGLQSKWLRHVADARSELADHSYAAIVLDVQPSNGCGYDLLAWLRGRGDLTPVVFLTVHGCVDERVRALDRGADDLLAKPVRVEELISRLRALIRRSAGQGSMIWELGPIRIDIARQQVRVAEQACELSPKELVVLLELVKHAGRVVPRRSLEQSVFRTPESIESNALEVHIHKLRRKLGVQMIQTVRGVGYRMNA